MNKLNIAIIFGGLSSEYSVSLQSSHAIINHLDDSKYIPILIGISDKGQWYRFIGNIDKIADNTWCNNKDCIPAIISPCRSTRGLIEFLASGTQLTAIDVALPVLHGKNGEDGTIQGLLELAGIPIVGCDTISSSLCMDKYKAHMLVRSAGIKTPMSFLLNKTNNIAVVLAQAESFGYPFYVKPARGGSSIGITKVTCRKEFPQALKTAFKHDDRILVEQSINGIEVGCAILGNDELLIGEVDEIELTEDFFSFTEKYNLTTSKIHMPARISDEISSKIKNTATIIYRTLGCRGFARADMFLTPKGEIYFNEVNTIPGFTPHSRYPNMLSGIGLGFGEIVDIIIGLAVKP